MWCVTSTSGAEIGTAGDRTEDAEQPLPGSHVEARRRLVQEEDLGSAHERPGQEDVLALALGDDPELTIGDPVGPTHPGARPTAARPPLQSSSL